MNTDSAKRQNSQHNRIRYASSRLHNPHEHSPRARIKK